MNIGIDARLYGLDHTGIGRYVAEIINQLLKVDSQNQYVIFTHPKYINSIPKAKNVSLVSVSIRHYSLKEQLFLKKIITGHRLDLVHFPHFNVPLNFNAPFVVTIHDLLWHEKIGFKVTTLNPLVYSLKYLGYKAVVKHALFKSFKIITPSNWVKDQILFRFPKLAAGKISVTYEGVNQTFSASSQKPKNYLIYAGSLYPHKNVSTLIKALSLVKDIPLIIVSSRSIFTQEITKLVNKLNLNHRVKFVGFKSDPELNRLYAAATALVHPSTSEGFGLTGLEAMAVGTPVISSRAASLPEVYGQAAVFFDPQNHQQLAKIINRLIKDQPFRSKLKKAGIQQAKKYSWQTTARQTLKIYQSL